MGIIKKAETNDIVTWPLTQTRRQGGRIPSKQSSKLPKLKYEIL